MSVISNIHTAQVYDAKHSKAFEGQRLVVTIAKKDKDGNYGPHLQQTMCTSIPVLSKGDIDFTLPSIQDACVEYFRTVQNSIINARIKDGKKEVSTQELDTVAIVQFLNAESSGDKWDSARIATWFQDVMAEHIGEALILKGFDDTKLEQSLNAYSKLISETFESRAVIPRKKAEAIDKAFKLIPAESQDATYARFAARLAKVLEESDMGELLGL